MRQMSFILVNYYLIPVSFNIAFLYSASKLYLSGSMSFWDSSLYFESSCVWG